MDQEQSDRAEAMYTFYSEGATLARVGYKFGLTRERVRQVFDAHGFPRLSLSERRAREVELRADEIVGKFRELRDERSVAEDLNLPIRSVNGILRQRLPAAELRRHAKYPKKYSDDELISMLQEASQALGGVLTKDDFETYGRGRALSRGRPWPTGQTHMHRFGSWRKSLAVAGLRANPSSAIHGQTLFDEAHCTDAIRHVARELDKVPTCAEYELFAKGTNGALPSSATVRNRCGRWYEALGKAGL